MSYGAHLDSADGLQWHVRWKFAESPDTGPYRSYVTDDEQDARDLLAMYQREPGVMDVQLFVRDVSPWKEVES